MPSYSTPSMNLSTGVSTKPTRLIPDYLGKSQNFVPLSVFFAGIPEPEADPDSLFGFRMPPREKKAVKPKEKKAKGGDTKNSKDAKDDSGDDDKKEKDSKGNEAPNRPQTAQPRPQQPQKGQAPQQAAQPSTGAKQEAKGTINNPQKCTFCKEQADKRIIWADGRAYIPVCSKHVEKGKKFLEKKNGEWAEIVGVRTVKPMGESLSQLLDIAMNRQSVASVEMTTTANVPTLPVPIGAGDGRKFLDSPDDGKKRKKKKRTLSQKLYVLLRQ